MQRREFILEINSEIMIDVFDIKRSLNRYHTWNSVFNLRGSIDERDD